MKKLTTLLYFIIVSTLSFGQIVETFTEAKKQGILDSVERCYKNAVNKDSSKAAFPGRTNDVSKTWVDMCNNLGDYLAKQGFKWGKETEYFHRVYFKSDGRIDYILYSFKSGVIDSVKEKDFKKLLMEFSESYKFPMTAKENFDQCGHIVFVDPKEDKK